MTNIIHMDPFSTELECIQIGGLGEFVPGKPQFSGGCFGFNREKREGIGDLITVFVEDDGYWHKKECFDIAWAPEIIELLMETVR